MYLKAHYDLPDDCTVDINIQKPNGKNGHEVSIIAKAKNTLYRTILPVHYFESLEHPIIKINSFEAPDVKASETLIEIFEECEENSTICFDFQTGSNYALLEVEEETVEFVFEFD